MARRESLTAIFGFRAQSYQDTLKSQQAGFLEARWNQVRREARAPVSFPCAVSHLPQLSTNHTPVFRRPLFLLTQIGIEALKVRLWDIGADHVLAIRLDLPQHHIDLDAHRRIAITIEKRDGKLSARLTLRDKARGKARVQPRTGQRIVTFEERL